MPCHSDWRMQRPSIFCYPHGTSAPAMNILGMVLNSISWSRNACLDIQVAFFVSKRLCFLLTSSARPVSAYWSSASCCQQGLVAFSLRIGVVDLKQYKLLCLPFFFFQSCNKQSKFSIMCYTLFYLTLRWTAEPVTSHRSHSYLQLSAMVVLRSENRTP